MSLTNLEVRDLQWRKATRSVGNGACVEVAAVNGQIAIRDSNNPDGHILRYSAKAFRSFVEVARSDDFWL
ncbi:MAG: DUF397 domain-containing protein [Streptosporangiaceae bacterium]